MQRIRTLAGAVVVLLLAANFMWADTFTFTAQTIINTMAANGAPLHDANYQWGLWAVRVVPVVNGTYTITGGSTTQSGWGVSAPSSYVWPAPFTNSAWFYDLSGSEVAGNPANPLYMIMDRPADTFTSYTFDSGGNAVGSVPPDAIVPPGATGGGTNIATAVDPDSLFTVNFTLGPNSGWDGSWQFVVDGSQYTLGTTASPGVWVENFWGGYGDSGGLAQNMASGYAVPEPGSIVLLLTVAVGTGLGLRRKRSA